MKKKYMNNRGFTLVELIVVVTILSILGTIGFVSYSSYLSGVRDVNRTSSLQSMSDGLALFSTQGTPPTPDNAISIISGGETIGYQGDIGTTVLETIDYSKTGLDPKDKIPFTYYLSTNRKYHQLMGFLEESDNIQAYNILFSQANASQDYSNRYPIFYGKKLGILTDPITLVPSHNSGTNIDISTTTDQYAIHLGSDKYVLGDATNLLQFSSLPERGGRGYTIDSTGRLIYINLDLGVSRNGLVGEYHFDGNFNDSSGEGNHGSTVGGGSYINAQVGQGIDVLAAQNPIINYDADSSLQIDTNKYTFSIWFNMDVLQSAQMIQNHAWNAGGYYVGISGSQQIQNTYSGNSSTISHSFDLSSYFIPDYYHHYVATSDGTTMKAYLDGVLISETSASLPLDIASARSNMSIAGYQFEGTVDQVRIYNRDLSQSEVQLLYNE